MIEQTSIMGMPLKTQRQRRLLVIGYYKILVGGVVDGVAGACGGAG